MLALGSEVVHHAGLSIQGCASSPGPQGIAVAGPVGVDHSMDFFGLSRRSKNRYFIILFLPFPFAYSISGNPGSP